MDEHDRRYVVVTDAQNRALGYVRRRDLHRQQGSCGDFLRPFNATAAHDEHLRILLSRMYEFNRAGCRCSMPSRCSGRGDPGVHCGLPEFGAFAWGKTSIVSPAEAVVAL